MASAPNAGDGRKVMSAGDKVSDISFLCKKLLKTMPIQQVKGGFRWGSHGKVYPTKEQAEAQGRAAYASGDAMMALADVVCRLGCGMTTCQ